jgi:hypothetical protein
LRSQARRFASKLAIALPPRTVTRCDGSQRTYCRPSLPSGSVTGTAAPLRAAMWRPPTETVGVVEHSPRSPRLWSCGINTGVGVNLLFLPPQCLLLPPLLCLLRFIAGLRNRGGTPPPTCSTPAPTLDDVQHFRRRRRRRSSPRHCWEIGSSSERSPSLHRRRTSFGKLYFPLCSSPFLLLCSFAMVTLLA